MNSLRRILILSLLFMIFVSVSADGQDANYLPLEVGNSWEYVELIEGPTGEVIDSAFWGPTTVQERLTLENKDYYVLSLSLFLADTLHMDSIGNIVALEGGLEKTIFDFTGPDSSMYSYFSSRDSIEFDVFLSRDLFVETPSGNFAGCLSLSFEALGAVDASRIFVFCDGSGIVQTNLGFGGDLRLFAGNVGGVTVTHVQENNIPTIFSHSPVYPNPVQSIARIPFNVGTDGTNVRMVLYDLLGREKGLITNRFYNPGNHVVFVDVSGIPNGLYSVQSRVGVSAYNTVFIVQK